MFDPQGRLDSRISTLAREEMLILVDEDDKVLGHRFKKACHDGDGVLHRAFSVLLFDARGRMLLQQRSPGKRLWPGFWSNACCSHPRQGETRTDAARRRMKEELGVGAELDHLYTFTYHASYGEVGSEHEVCAVFAGSVTDEISADPFEIAAWRWMWPDELDRELEARPERFTPWFRLEWERVRREHGRTFSAADPR